MTKITAEAVVVSAILTAIVFLPQWRFGFNMGDEGWLWYLSQRISAGDLPIRDYFSYDPGRYFWSALWFRILGHDGLLEQRIANAVFGAIGLAAAYACLIKARIAPYWRIIVAALIAMALGYPRHKTYEQALSLISVAATMFVLLQPGQVLRWAVLGMATGMAAFIGRNHGMFFVAAAMLTLALTLWLIDLRTAIRASFAYGLGVVIGYLPMLWLLATDQRFLDAFVEIFKFTSQWQLPLPIPFPWRQHADPSTILGIQQIAIGWLCVAVTVIYGIALFRLAIRLKQKAPLTARSTLEVAALAAGLPYLYQSFERADFGHIAQGIVPMFLLTAAQCTGPAKKFFATQYVIFASLACVSWLPAEPRVLAHIIYKQGPSELTAVDISGQTYIINADQAKIMMFASSQKSKCKLKDGEFFTAPYYPGLYAFLHLRAPFWELYHLYKRNDEFQAREIHAFETYGTKVFLINEMDAVDAREDLKLPNTSPLITSYIKNHATKLDPHAALPGNFDTYVRNCGDARF